MPAASTAGSAVQPTVDAFAGQRVAASPQRRIDLCQQCVDCVANVAEEWAEVAARAKGLGETPDSRVEDLLSGPAVVLRFLQSAIQTLRAIAPGGTPEPPGQPYRGPTGQWEVPVLPATGLFDQLTFAGIRAAVRLLPETQLARVHGDRVARATRAEFDGIAAVLGAGNVSAIPATDSLQQILFENHRVLLKFNPVNEALLPVFDRAFAPLIREGLLQLLRGGPEIGGALIQHPAVTTVHITGAAATHDAIVWGATPEERRHRKQSGQPLLTRSITSELGNVSPWIVVPGDYSARQLSSQAEHIAASITNNASFNCLATKVIVTWSRWPQREAFLQKVRHFLNATPLRRAYYPGAEGRYHRFTGTTTSLDDQGCLPWALLTDQSVTERPELFQEESFVCVCAETALGGDSPEQFLDAAIEFVNDQLAGTLCASLTLPPGFRRRRREVVDRSLHRLRYGTVCVNQWSGLAYGLASPPWGGYPGATLEDPASGLGHVHNTLLLDRIEKTVLEGPLVNFPHPVWFPSHRGPLALARALVKLYQHPSFSRLPGLGMAVVRGL